MNLNRLSQNELDYLCDKEGDESSDSDFEVTVDHVEPASSEVIKVKHSFEDGLLSLVLLTCDCGSTRSASARRWGGNRLESRLNTAMTLKMVSTDTMSGALHFYLKGILWFKTGATHYHAKLGLLANSHTIKELVG